VKISFPVTDHIRGKLHESGVKHGETVHVIQHVYDHFRRMIREQYQHLKEEDQHALTVLFCLTHPNHKQQHFEVNHPVASRKQKLVELLERQDVAVLAKWLFAGALLLLLSAIAAHAQKGTSRIDVITFQDSAGNPVKTFAAPFKIKCSTNLTCTVSGPTLTMSASSTASAAFSSLTASTNSNLGTFAVSGNTWDFSAAVLLKLRIGAGLTTSTNGDCGYDTTKQSLALLARRGRSPNDRLNQCRRCGSSANIEC
jgi:hypothetical protein